MDAKQIKILKASLLKEKEEIEARLSEIAKKNPAIKGDWTSVPSDISDPSDTLDEKAQVVTNLEERRAIEQNLEIKLREIDETLKQLESGIYGICANCNFPINKERLKVMPAVRLCIKCANNPSLT